MSALKPEQLVRDNEALRITLRDVRDFLILAQVMIPGGQPEYRQCREWIDRLREYDTRVEDAVYREATTGDKG